MSGESGAGVTRRVRGAYGALRCFDSETFSSKCVPSKRSDLIQIFSLAQYVQHLVLGEKKTKKKQAIERVMNEH